MTCHRNCLNIRVRDADDVQMMYGIDLLLYSYVYVHSCSASVS